MALLYNKSSRDLAIKGVITLTTNEQINITSSDVVSYTSNGSVGTEGIPLGTTESVSYNLTLNNVGRRFTPAQLDNAEVHMFIGIKDGGDYVYSDFGVWWVNDTIAPEQSVTITLNGFDALATRFSAVYEDSKGVYPTTIGRLAETVCAAAQVPLARTNFLNAAVEISKMPSWEDETTLRDILSYCAIAAAGFVRMTRDGQVDIVSYAESETYSLTPDMYQTFTPTGGYSFSFNRIEAFMKEDDDERSAFWLEENIPPNATNTIQIDYNPLLTETIMQTVVSELAGIELSSGEVAWGGDPSVKLGDCYEITDLKGVKHKIMVNNQSFTFNGGLTTLETCNLPALNTQMSATYSTGANMYDAKGNLRATRISGLDKSIVSATIGHFEQLDSETIQTDKLVSNWLSAIDLLAGEIDAGEIETNILTAITAKIMKATIDKLNAGTIETDDLYAAVADIVKLNVRSVDADKIDADTLTGALAQFNVLTAETAEFNRATAENLVANLFNLTGEGVMEDVFIHNLKVAYAQVLNATIGNLVLKSKERDENGDPIYCEIVVDKNGNVTAVPVKPNVDEIAEGVFKDTKPILETSMTVDDMNATDIKAVHMLVNRIDAASIDTDELFAREAFIGLLRTSRIVGEKSIEMIVGDVEDVQALVRLDDDGLHVGDGANSSEVLIDETSVNVVMNGQKYSQFASNYVQFGNYQLRQSADGGLVFKLKEG